MDKNIENQLYKISSGKPGKKFTEEQFLELFDGNKYIHPLKKIKYESKTNDGYVFCCESKYEKSFVDKITKKNSYLLLRGDCLVLKNKKDSPYYPDIVLLLKNGYIVVVEIKEIGMMASKDNVSKYNRLANYCKNHGYLYMMCDNDFNTYDNLIKMPHSSKLQKEILNIIDNKKYFNYDDYKEIINKKIYKSETIRKAIAICVLENNLKMIGDLTHKIKNLRIRRKKFGTGL